MHTHIHTRDLIAVIVLNTLILLELIILEIRFKETGDLIVIVSSFDHMIIWHIYFINGPTLSTADIQALPPLAVPGRWV